MPGPTPFPALWANCKFRWTKATCGEEGAPGLDGGVRKQRCAWGGRPAVTGRAASWRWLRTGGRSGPRSAAGQGWLCRAVGLSQDMGRGPGPARGAQKRASRCPARRSAQASVAAPSAGSQGPEAPAMTISCERPASQGGVSIANGPHGGGLL